jgi:hypothetical protein
MFGAMVRNALFAGLFRLRVLSDEPVWNDSALLKISGR